MVQRSGTRWIGWLWSALVLAQVCAASQREQEWAEESADEGSGLVASIAFGCAAGRVGFRLEAHGGAPLSGGLLWIERQRMDGSFGKAGAEPVLFDADGRAEIVVRDVRLDEELHARFAANGAAGLALSNEVVIPAGGGTWLQTVQRGDVVISEIMKDPTFVSDAAGEWFELYNPTNKTRNIAGWHLLDLGSNKHTIDNGGGLLLIGPGQRLVLGVNADPALNGGVQVDYEYSSFTLGNSADSILLVARNGVLVDQVDYDDGIFWPDTAGTALNLDPAAMDALLNDDPIHWCDATTQISASNPDHGTPGTANDVCP